MKTLDEVIKALELCLDNKIKCNHCPYHEEGCPESRKADALHYLKAYRDDKDDLTALRAYWAEMHKDVRQKAEVTDESNS